MTARRLRLVLLALGVGAVGAIGAGGADRASAPQRRVIRMRAVSYAPAELRAAVGDTIVWQNVDLVRHDAVREGLFDTGELQPGDSASWIPTDTGTFAYRCTIHQRMRGRLVVESQHN